MIFSHGEIVATQRGFGGAEQLDAWLREEPATTTTVITSILTPPSQRVLCRFKQSDSRDDVKSP